MEGCITAGVPMKQFGVQRLHKEAVESIQLYCSITDSLLALVNFLGSVKPWIGLELRASGSPRLRGLSHCEPHIALVEFLQPSSP
jgi:hypothetical protein